MKSTSLKFWWILCVKHGGRQISKIWKQKVWVYWKPLLWFVKGDKPNAATHTDIHDLIESQPPDKALHEWQQSPVEAEYLIKYLTIEGQLVVDPFMGSGTTGIAALQQNRKFIGIEIDQESFTRAKSNLVRVVKTVGN